MSLNLPPPWPMASIGTHMIRTLVWFADEERHLELILVTITLAPDLGKMSLLLRGLWSRDSPCVARSTFLYRHLRIDIMT